MKVEKYEYDYLAIEPSKDGFTVYGFGKYPRSSVNYGMTRKVFLDSFKTEAEAIKAYPAADSGGGVRQVQQDPGPIAPSWFNPADAGENWDSDE